jgi:hypothetical protein
MLFKKSGIQLPNQILTVTVVKTSKLDDSGHSGREAVYIHTDFSEKYFASIFRFL